MSRDVERGHGSGLYCVDSVCKDMRNVIIVSCPRLDRIERPQTSKCAVYIDNSFNGRHEPRSEQDMSSYAYNNTKGTLGRTSRDMPQAVTLEPITAKTWSRVQSPPFSPALHC